MKFKVFTGSLALIMLTTLAIMPMAMAATVTKVIVHPDDWKSDRLNAAIVNDGPVVDNVLRLGKPGQRTVAAARALDGPANKLVEQNRGKQVRICAKARVTAVGSDVVGASVRMGDMRTAEFVFTKNKPYQTKCVKRSLPTQINTQNPEYGNFAVGKGGVPNSVVYLDRVTVEVL